ncbi:MAG: AAA family ATPase [Nanoarchaeota archaeon]|nr:AAA family ATPase [Nanoarchaeota archaeon]
MPKPLDLETVLRSIPWTQHFNSIFQATVGEKIITVNTPVYAVPTRMINQKLQIGINLPSGGLRYIPIGLIQQKNFCATPYHFTRQRRWEAAEKKRNNLVYLAVEKLPYQLDIPRPEKFLKKSPFNLYTLQGLEYPYPFVLLEEESEDGLVQHIPYQNHREGMSWYRRKMENPEPWQDYLEQLDDGRYVDLNLDHPEERIITISAPRKKYSASSAETTPLVLADPKIDWTDPVSINQSLDTVVESQHEAKKIFSVAISQYITGAMKGDLHLHPVVLLIGPTGVGKTLMASHIAEKTSLPKGSADLQMQSGQGYIGGNVTDVFEIIYRQAKEDAPYGYVVYNELDKLVVGDSHNWGWQLQSELLSILEKGQVQLSDEERKLTANGKRWFTTENLFFTFTGAFVGLEKVIAKRLGLEKRIGFGVQHQTPQVNKYELLKQVMTEDLIRYGLMPELVGRISVTAVLDPLSTADLKNILQKPSMSPITGHKTQLQQRGYTLEVDEQAFYTIAQACPTETGARALKGICGKIFTEIEYQPARFAKDKSIYVTPTLVEELLQGKYK